MSSAKMVGRRGEHIVAAFLCSQDWHPVISDAEGYDIVATKSPHMLRVQVKSCSRPTLENPRRTREYWRWSVGLGRHKEILIPTDQYDVLALVALGPDAIQFVDAEDVNKKTYRAKVEKLNDRTSEETWRGITANL